MSATDDENTPLIRNLPQSSSTNNRELNNVFSASGEVTEEELFGTPSVSDGPRRSLTIDHLGLVNAKYESLDYDPCENELYQLEEVNKSFQQIRTQQIARWVVMFVIGMCTGLIAAFIDITVHFLASIKYSLIKSCVCLTIPFFTWASWNVACIVTASLMVIFISPIAAGSGIPQVKCFLNGIKIPEVVRVKTLVCKVIGLCLAVAGSLAVGKEGPMVHSGAVVAAGVSQGRSTTFRIDCKLFEYFRSDQEKRDFVSGGAAAGVSAAFGAPVGGVLFSLEEGASFWNQGLTWRIFFASMTSTFTLNVVLSIYHGVPWQLAYSGLISFGKFDDFGYDGLEILIFIIMGAIGGLIGALFNQLNYKLTVFRMQYVRERWKKIMEAALIAAMTTVVAFTLIILVNDCQSMSKRNSENPLQVYCNDGEYNSMATMWFQTYESSVKSLFHDPSGTYSPLTVFLFCLFYFLLACWTYGISIPSGLFIPSLLIGAAWGRLIGIILTRIMAESIDPGKFALIGAAAQLGGILRMTISLTVILVEATGNISFGLPLMIVLMVAKWTGDLFNEGIFDMHIQLQQVPFLVWEPPPMTSTITARRTMSHPVTVLRTVEKVERVVNILRYEAHDGFPVVDDLDIHRRGSEMGMTFGTLRGLISRSQLIVLLSKKAFTSQEGVATTAHTLRQRHFREGYPRYPKIQNVEISDQDLKCWIDLTPYMNPAPYAVYDNTSLPRIFRLFRGLGLRHLVVIDRQNQVLGIVTRKDLTRYRYERHGGVLSVRELPILSS